MLDRAGKCAARVLVHPVAYKPVSQFDTRYPIYFCAFQGPGNVCLLLGQAGHGHTLHPRRHLLDFGLLNIVGMDVFHLFWLLMMMIFWLLIVPTCDLCFFVYSSQNGGVPFFCLHVIMRFQFSFRPPYSVIQDTSWQDPNVCWPLSLEHVTLPYSTFSKIVDETLEAIGSKTQSDQKLAVFISKKEVCLVGSVTLKKRKFRML